MREFGFSVGVGALVLTLSLAPVPLAIGAQYPAQPGELSLVIAPPWAAEGGPAGIVALLSGRLVGPVAAPFATFAILDDPLDARAHGAWAVLDGRAIAAICGLNNAGGHQS